MNNIKKISPWAWVPTLYFAQGIPYFIVNNISVLMFAKMGVPNGDMALFTSLLYLPWTIKPFWSPFVDIIRTKRWWVVSMQILMSIAFHPADPDHSASGRSNHGSGHDSYQYVHRNLDTVYHHGIRFRHTRYCRRRVLYAGIEIGRAG